MNLEKERHIFISKQDRVKLKEWVFIINLSGLNDPVKNK